MRHDRVIGVIPSGGSGVRMKPFRALKELTTIGYRYAVKEGSSISIPKVLGEYTLDNMLLSGVEDIIIIINENKSELIKFYGNGKQYGANIVYACQEQDSALYGMPVAFDSCYSWIKNSTVIMGMPDTMVLPSDCFSTLLDLYDEKNADLVLGVFPTDHPQTLAPVEFDEETKKIINIYDKPKETSIYNTWNIAVWSGRFTDLIHKYVGEQLKLVSGRKEIIIGDVFNDAISKGLNVYCNFFEEGHCFDLGDICKYDSMKIQIEKAFLQTN